MAKLGLRGAELQRVAKPPKHDAHVKAWRALTRATEQAADDVRRGCVRNDHLKLAVLDTRPGAIKIGDSFGDARWYPLSIAGPALRDSSTFQHALRMLYLEH